jgi:hypothetical protein
MWEKQPHDMVVVEVGVIPDDIAHCRQRIEDEERRARSAGSPEAGEVHAQMAMLYRAQLAMLERIQARDGYLIQPVRADEHSKS